MEDLVNPGIMATIVTSVIGGIGFLVKYILNKRDEAQKKIFEERDKDKADMNDRIVKVEKRTEKVEKQLHNVIGMILKCKDPNCPTKEVLANYWEKEHGNENK